MHNHRKLITKAGIIGNTVWNGTRQNMRMAILMLQALTVQCGTASGCAKQEALCLCITRCPCNVTNALETKHGVVHIHWNHRQVIG